MSRNFDLLTEIVHQSVMTDDSHVNATDRVASTAVVPSRSDGDDVDQNEIQQLVRRIFLSMNGTAPRKVVFCGVDVENGSSHICERVGRALAANSSQSVCLVDANIRSRWLSRRFGFDLDPRSVDVSMSIREQCMRIDGNFWLAKPNVFARDRDTLPPVEELDHLLTQLRSIFDYVLIDAPGMNTCADASLLGQVSDAAILVIEANTTRRLTARKAKEALEAAGVRLLGTVLRNRVFPIPQSLYNFL